MKKIDVKILDSRLGNEFHATERGEGGFGHSGKH